MCFLTLKFFYLDLTAGGHHSWELFETVPQDKRTTQEGSSQEKLALMPIPHPSFWDLTQCAELKALTSMLHPHAWILQLYLLLYHSPFSHMAPTGLFCPTSSTLISTWAAGACFVLGTDNELPRDSALVTYWWVEGINTFCPLMQAQTPVCRCRVESINSVDFAGCFAFAAPPSLPSPTFHSLVGLSHSTVPWSLESQFASREPSLIAKVNIGTGGH